MAQGADGAAHVFPRAEHGVEHGDSSTQFIAGRHVVDSSPLCGSDLTQLTIALGQKLARELVHEEPARVPADTFTNEAFTRAMHAAREQRYQMAQDYLQVCAASQATMSG
jgi:hypothetical protein